MAARSNQESANFWRKSRASSGEGECVEVGRLGRSVLVRDSRDRSGHTLRLTSGEWRTLLTSIQNGDFDHG
jgi:Domain of unknown function (DUF397)